MPPEDAQKTIEQAIEQVAHQFSQVDLSYGHGTSNAWDEAAWAVHHVLGLPYDIRAEEYQNKITQEQAKAIHELALSRMLTRKPMAYLTNSMWFAGLEFYIDERTLVPRSPIAELILNGFVPWLDINNVTKVLDLCTGSGCIGLAIAYYFPELDVTASDISPDALAVAKINCTRLGIEERVHLLVSDMFSDVPPESFDLIVSNPPYVPVETVAGLPDEYQQEPDMGLVSGVNGLQHVEIILRESLNYLSDNGVLIVEVGLSQNSLADAHPALPFMWLDFEHGGEGVFLLTAQQLRSYFQDS